MKGARFGCVVACLAVFAWLSAANERVALVIGNAAYEHVPPLANPRNDAEDMAGLLQRLGFVVTEGLDLTDSAMKDRIRAFARRARGAEVALVFYAGHGMQVGGVNYLLPVDARLADELDLDFEAVALDLVLRSMGTGTNLVFLDACRDNPFSRGWAGAARSLVGRGLKRVEGGSASGMFIAFATDPDSIAADGDGRNSPFTAALKRHIETPGLEVNSLLTEVRNSVLKSTGNVQRPWSNSSLSAAFYFVPPPSSPIGDPAPRPVAGVPDPAAEAWKQIQATADVRQLERYIAAYPNSPYRTAAEFRLNELRRQPFTVTPEPPSARVRLVDLSEPYQAGMMLPAGEYRVEVSADGYETATESVSHGTSPTVRRMTLRKAGPTVGDSFRDCAECPEMVVLPAGSYRMGSPSYEQRRGEDEGPVREVTIAAPFAIGRHEVTVAEFGRFVDETGYSAGSSCRTYESGEWESRAGRGWRNPGFGQSGRHPVACVNWNDAQAYAAWLSRETGEQYRLPSESEWEYAARAGTATARYWGEGESGQCRHANGADASAKESYSGWTVASCRDGHVHTAPAGSFAANGWGLHDMLGNVWEWTEDCWNGSYAGAPSDGSAWKYGDCAKRVLRGGSWFNVPSGLRAANRFRNTTGLRSIYYGFRVARTLAP